MSSSLMRTYAQTHIDLQMYISGVGMLIRFVGLDTLFRTSYICIKNKHLK